MLAIPALTCPAVVSANDEPPAEPLALEEMQVTASAERADGPVQGYRATRSASATRTDTVDRPDTKTSAQRAWKMRSTTPAAWSAATTSAARA